MVVLSTMKTLIRTGSARSLPMWPCKASCVVSPLAVPVTKSQKYESSHPVTVVYMIISTRLPLSIAPATKRHLLGRRSGRSRNAP